MYCIYCTVVYRTQQEQAVLFLGCLGRCTSPFLISNKHSFTTHTPLQHTHTFAPQGEHRVTVDTLTLGHLLTKADLIITHCDAIKSLDAQAQGEGVIRKVLDEVEGWAVARTLSTTPYTLTGSTTRCVLFCGWVCCVVCLVLVCDACMLLCLIQNMHHCCVYPV